MADQVVQAGKRLYTIMVQVYNQAKYVDVDLDCNGWTATNIGDTIANVEGMVLYPGVPGTSLGDSRSVGGNLGEVYRGRIRVSFDAGANPAIEIVQKVYLKS